MNINRNVIAAFLCSLLLTQTTPAAVRGDHAEYKGGTVTSIPVGTQGEMDLSDTKNLKFHYKKTEYQLPYDQITGMEFGQKVGRRVGATVALGVTTLGIGALPMLFSKKKKHFLTVAFTAPDATKGVLVLELAKGTVRTSLPTLEARTGKKVELEADVAKQGKDRN